MIVEFPYNNLFESVYIPDENLIGVFEPSEFNEVADRIKCIEGALDNPIGSERLETAAKGGKSALIISDDYTRQTPVDIIIPLVERRLKAADVENIKILIAHGTHRPTTNEEKIKKFGDDICSRFEIIDHNYKDSNQLVDLGTTDSGTHFEVNRHVFESDFVIGLGQIVPHRICGYSGGAKIILPGVCGAEATAHTHWVGGFIPGEEMLGKADNVVRDEMNKCAEMARLRYIVNTILDPSGRLIYAVSGDFVDAHREGCKLSEKVFGVKVPKKADIVITDSYPKDIELWQAAKAMYAADLMVREGGVVILISPCYEGVSRAHPQILERGYTTEEETLCDLNAGLINRSVASHCLRMGRLIKEKAKGIMVKNYIPKEDQEKLGFIYAETPQDALEKAFEIVGRDASVAVLKHGGEALPVVG